jgi:hypothetical protein
MKIIVTVVICLTLGYILGLAGYDPCGYVGSSNDPKLPEQCLATGPDCCYMSWNYTNFLYYSCVSKTKVLSAKKGNNASWVFIQLLDGGTYDNVNHVIYSRCNDTKAIQSPTTRTPPVLQFRALMEVDTYYESYQWFQDQIMFLLKYLFFL